VEGLDSHKNALNDAHGKSIHAKIFNPSIWKKQRNDDMVQKVGFDTDTKALNLLLRFAQNLLSRDRAWMI
jgi:hypothetical protein